MGRIRLNQSLTHIHPFPQLATQPHTFLTDQTILTPISVCVRKETARPTLGNSDADIRKLQLYRLEINEPVQQISK